MASNSIIARKIAATAAGALVFAGLSTSALLTPAHASVNIDDAIFACTVPMFSASMDYPTDIDFTAKRTSADKVSITAKLDAMPPLAPVPMNDLSNSGDMSVTVDGQAVSLTGTIDGLDVPANAPIPVPTLSGTATSKGTSVAIAIEEITFKAFSGFEVVVDCVPKDDADLSATVPVEKAVPAKVAPKTTVKVKVNKKRVATVTAKVAGKKGAATGKVNLVVKKGKKTVQKKSVKLNKKGVAKTKLKKLKKGKYSVSVKYAGNKAYKKGQKKASFRVK